MDATWDPIHFLSHAWWCFCHYRVGLQGSNSNPRMQCDVMWSRKVNLPLISGSQISRTAPVITATPICKKNINLRSRYGIAFVKELTKLIIHKCTTKPQTRYDSKVITTSASALLNEQVAGIYLPWAVSTVRLHCHDNVMQLFIGEWSLVIARLGE